MFTHCYCYDEDNLGNEAEVFFINMLIKYDGLTAKTVFCHNWAITC